MILIFILFGFILAQDNYTACFNNGVMFNGTTTCSCFEGFEYLPDCSVTKCFGVFSNDSTVCNGLGTCVAKDVCRCPNGEAVGDCSSPTTTMISINREGELWEEILEIILYSLIILAGGGLSIFMVVTLIYDIYTLQPYIDAAKNIKLKKQDKEMMIPSRTQVTGLEARTSYRPKY